MCYLKNSFLIDGFSKQSNETMQSSLEGNFADLYIIFLEFFFSQI